MCKVLTFIKNAEIPEHASGKTKMSIVEMFLYDKLDKKSVSAFVNGTGYLVKSIDLLYSKSEYRDYILPV